MLEKQQKKIRRHKKIRAKLKGTMRIPRLCVFRSAKHIYAQLIDDEKSIILATARDQELKKSPHMPERSEGRRSSKKQVSSLVSPSAQRTNVLRQKEISTSHKKPKEEKTGRTGKIGIAFEVGKLIAKKASEKKIDKIIFDRGGYKYHGRIKSLAEGVRAGGLKF